MLQLVFQDHVTDFVCQKTGQLVLGVDLRQNPARHINMTTGQRERVGLGPVDNFEPETIGRIVQRGCQPAALAQP